MKVVKSMERLSSAVWDHLNSWFVEDELLLVVFAHTANNHKLWGPAWSGILRCRCRCADSEVRECSSHAPHKSSANIFRHTSHFVTRHRFCADMQASRHVQRLETHREYHASSSASASSDQCASKESRGKSIHTRKSFRYLPRTSYLVPLTTALTPRGG